MDADGDDETAAPHAQSGDSESDEENSVDGLIAESIREKSDPIKDDHEASLRNQVKLRLLLAGVDVEDVKRLDDPAQAETANPVEMLRSRLLWGHEPPITIAELAERSGLEIELCRRARMLLGLPDPGDAALCQVQEIEAFAGFAAGIALFGEEPILHFTRVIGSALASIAEGSLSVFGRSITDLAGEEELESIHGDAYTLAVFDALESFHIVPTVLQTASKLQFEQTTARLTADPGLPQFAAVGFVDLTGSTFSTEKLGMETMAGALTRFEEWSAELTVAKEGRVIKYIGDEVMYMTPTLESAAGIAAELLRRVADDPVLTSARGGVAYGTVLNRDGDWFGTTVNIAARLVDKAKPKTILITGEGAEHCEGAVHKGRKRLRDLNERVEVWRLQPE